MPLLHALPFRGNVEVVTLSFITCHNLCSGKHALSPFFDCLTVALAPTLHKLSITKIFENYGFHSSFTYWQFNIDFRIVIRRFCLMSPSTAKIVLVLITTCSGPRHGKFMFSLSVSQHGQHRNMAHLVKHCSLYKAFIPRKIWEACSPSARRN